LEAGKKIVDETLTIDDNLGQSHGGALFNYQAAAMGQITPTHEA